MDRRETLCKNPKIGEKRGKLTRSSGIIFFFSSPARGSTRNPVADVASGCFTTSRSDVMHTNGLFALKNGPRKNSTSRYFRRHNVLIVIAIFSPFFFLQRGNYHFKSATPKTPVQKSVWWFERWFCGRAFRILKPPLTSLYFDQCLRVDLFTDDTLFVCSKFCLFELDFLKRSF